jgi:hypothetical protein
VAHGAEGHLIVRARSAFAAMASLAAIALTGAAQEIRFGGSTVGQVIQLPTLVIDSVPIGATTGSGNYRQTSNGYVAWCPSTTGYCFYHRSGPTITTSPLTQDLEVNAFGFGQGLRFYADVRLRVTGGNQAWPLSGQTFSALAAYLEYDRSDWRARLGRQFTSNGLGYYNYDGLEVLWRASPWIDAQLYGGGALMEGVNAPYTNSVITDPQSPPLPNDNAWLIGARVRGHWQNGSSISALFQVIDRNDFGGLYSERLAVNGVFHAGITTITADVQADLATNQFDLAQARAQYPLARGTGVFLEVRHFVPVFELYSIWSVFSPVGYNELTGGAFWASHDGVLSAQLAGGYRSYEPTNAGTGDLTTNGFRIGADATWQAIPKLIVRGGYHYDLGPGAAESDGNLSARWEPNEDLYAGIFATAFQTAYEYQQGFGTVFGGGVTGGMKLNDWGRVALDVGEFRNTYGGNAPQSNWNQFRALLRFDFLVGKEPGYAGGGVVR